VEGGLGRALRAEIQGLRAVAVLLVLGYHVWPSILRGGFVGVDVFFAISGYLITAQLLREAQATGSVSALAFWARRARRILPAALVVLQFCTVATFAVVSRVHWEAFLTEIRASALYMENWHLAGTAVDYLAADEAATPVRHFWSLSAEEQFYLAWPLLILAGARAGRRGIATVLAAVTVVSFAWSVRATIIDPASAFFITPARAWEFGIGGMLALAPAVPVTRSPARMALSWSGLLAIVVAAAAYSATTPFPGIAALVPVLGATAVIWAAAPVAPLRFGPAQFLGDISYSVYLWHWPLLVLTPIALDHSLTTPERLAVVGVAIFLGWLSKTAVEDPVRHGRFLMQRRAAWTFGAAGVATAAVAALAAVGAGELRDTIREARRNTSRVLERPPSCFGAAARDPIRRCDDRALRQLVVPTPVEAHEASNGPCTRVERGGPLTVCAFGTRKVHAVVTVALIGDSHASHWRATVDAVAEARRWRALSIAHTSCPLSTAVPDIPEPRRSECVRWRRDVREWLARHPEVTTVFVSESVASTVVVPPGRDPFDAQVQGYRDAWAHVPRSVARIVVLRDTPRALPHGATLECVERAMRNGLRAGRTCALPRSRALWPDPAAVAARRESPHISTVDLTPFFCDHERCFPVVGGALVHRDVSHMTAAFAETLAPYLLRELRALAGDRR
jgi:peptidoglycan/LPS O-acetylase OafA/YrhL